MDPIHPLTTLLLLSGNTRRSMEIVLNHRVASYPNLLHLPVLYNIIAGGQTWAHKVVEKFPLEVRPLYDPSDGWSMDGALFRSLALTRPMYHHTQPTLLFHASFGIAVANSIVFLGATLKDRKLMTLRQWLLLQVVVLVSWTPGVDDALRVSCAL